MDADIEKIRKDQQDNGGHRIFIWKPKSKKKTRAAKRYKIYYIGESTNDLKGE